MWSQCTSVIFANFFLAPAARLLYKCDCAFFYSPLRIVMLWRSTTVFLVQFFFAPAARQEFFNQAENIKEI